MALVDQVAEELRTYRKSPMASCDLAAHILAIPAIHEALQMRLIVRSATRDVTVGHIIDLFDAEAV